MAMIKPPKIHKSGILIKAQRKGGKFLHGSLRKYGNKKGIAQQAIKGKV